MGSSLLRGKHSQPELIAQEENEGFTLLLRLSPLPPPFRELQLQRRWGPFEEPKPWQQPRLPEKPWRGTIPDGRDGIWEESLRLLRARGRDGLLRCTGWS